MLKSHRLGRIVQGIANGSRSRGLAAVLAVSSLACGGTTPSDISLSLSTTSVVGGTSAEGSISLPSGAPRDGAVVSLTSDDAAASVPSTVTVPAGATTATFTVSTSQVPVTVPAKITASYQDRTASATLSVQQIPTCGPFLSGEVDMPLVVYADGGDPRNHFIPSGYFGDVSDLTLDPEDRSAPQGGSTAIRIDYRPTGPNKFAGVFWLCPADNWGETAGAGFNLAQARQVQFWARASNTGASAEFKVGGVGTVAPQATYPDSFDSTSTAPDVVELGTDWRQFTIDLAGRDLTHVIGGFMFVTSVVQNPTGVTVFLDDIVWQ